MDVIGWIKKKLWFFWRLTVVFTSFGASYMIVELLFGQRFTYDISLWAYPVWILIAIFLFFLIHNVVGKIYEKIFDSEYWLN